MKQAYSGTFSFPVWFICSVNFLIMTSRATGTGILVNEALASNDTNGLSEATFVLPEIWLIFSVIDK